MKKKFHRRLLLTTDRVYHSSAKCLIRENHIVRKYTYKYYETNLYKKPFESSQFNLCLHSMSHQSSQLVWFAALSHWLHYCILYQLTRKGIYSFTCLPRAFEIMNSYLRGANPQDKKRLNAQPLANRIDKPSGQMGVQCIPPLVRPWAMGVKNQERNTTASNIHRFCTIP